MKKIIFTVAAILFAGIVVNGQVVTKVMKPEGKFTAQYESKNPKENYTNLIDENVSTKYCVGKKGPMWIQYEAPAAVVVNQYSIASANDVPTRDPKEWVLKASKDGITWVELDVQKEQTFPTRKSERSFKAINKTAYKFYRLEIISNAGENMTQFSEWSLSNTK